MRTAISRVIVLATVLLAGTASGQSVSTVTSAFNASGDIAVDTAGNIYVANYGQTLAQASGTRVYKVTVDGDISIFNLSADPAVAMKLKNETRGSVTSFCATSFSSSNAVHQSATTTGEIGAVGDSRKEFPLVRSAKITTHGIPSRDFQGECRDIRLLIHMVVPCGCSSMAS